MFGILCPGESLGKSRLQPRLLFAEGLQPRLQRVDLPGELGQPLATVGDRTQLRRIASSLRVFGLLGLLAAAGGRCQRLLGRCHLLGEFGLLLRDPDGLVFERIRVASVCCGRLGIAVPHPFGGDLLRAGHSFGQRGQRIPVLLGCGEPGLQFIECQFRSLFGFTRGRQLCFCCVLAGLQFEFGCVIAGQRQACLSEVVCQQPGFRVAEFGLDGGSLACDRGLASQRFKLTADFGDQIGEPGQVRLGGFELADRLVLAAAVFEHAGGLFDESAADFGGGLQDLVELALPDDDVHLSAHAGVAEQLLDVQQPRGVAVDRVFGTAAAEQCAADGDLGVFDRQHTVGVVDRQRHFGAAQGCASGGAREDDVLHLCATQRLGALLAHDPGQRVHHVRFSGAVGPHDGGDAGLEVQARRRGERLESLQSQALEVHLTRPRVPRTRSWARAWRP